MPPISPLERLDLRQTREPPLVEKNLDHRRRRTTAAYTHIADARLVEAAGRVGAAIAAAMARAASLRRAPFRGMRRLRRPAERRCVPSVAVCRDAASCVEAMDNFAS